MEEVKTSSIILYLCLRAVNTISEKTACYLISCAYQQKS